MLKVSLETLEKMTNYGVQDEPHRRVAGNFALYSAPGQKAAQRYILSSNKGLSLEIILMQMK